MLCTICLYSISQLKKKKIVKERERIQEFEKVGQLRALPRCEAFLESLCTPVSSSNTLFSHHGPTQCAFPSLPWECLALPCPLKTQVKDCFREAFLQVPECSPLLSLLALCTHTSVLHHAVLSFKSFCSLPPHPSPPGPHWPLRPWSSWGSQASILQNRWGTGSSG